MSWLCSNDDMISLRPTIYPIPTSSRSDRRSTT